MVSGTRDNPPLETTLSSVYMWKRFHYRPNQSWPCIIIHNHILLSSSFPGSFDNSGFCEVNFHLRPHLYDLGYPRQPYPGVTLGELTFPCFVVKFKHPFIWMSPSYFGGRDNSDGLDVSPRQVGQPCQAGQVQFYCVASMLSSPFMSKSHSASHATCHATNSFRF